MSASAPRERLSREVLKWIQSLDLAYSVKNVRRDFANGFLVAEIFSRYDDKNVQMHCYDNGSSLAVRRDNWAQLMRYFGTRGFSVEAAVVDALIHCEPGAAVGFLNQAYTFLTDRRVPDPPKRVTQALPAFMKPTAATLVHEEMKGASLAEEQDNLTQESRLRSTLDEHERELQAQKGSDPSRFAKRKPRVLRGTTHSMGERVENPRVTVKKVTVRQLDADVSVLRAGASISDARAAHSKSVSSGRSGQTGAGGRQLSPSSLAADGSLSRDDGGFAPAGPDPAAPAASSRRDDGAAGPVRSTVDVLESALAPARAERPDLGPALSSFESFERAAKRGTVPDDVASAVLDRVRSAADALAAAALASPRDAHRALSLLSRCVARAPADGAVFVGAAEALGDMGRAAVARGDADTAQSLFSEFALPPLRAALAGPSPERRRAAVQAAFAFCADTCSAHARMLGACKDALGRGGPALSAFLQCAAEASLLEGALDASLLDLYLYYAVVGAALPAPHARAAAVGILAACVRVSAAAGDAVGVDLVLGLSDRLSALASDRAWAVRAQLVQLAADLLAALASGDAAGGEGKRDAEGKDGDDADGGPGAGDGLAAALRLLQEVVGADVAQLSVPVRYAAAASLTPLATAVPEAGAIGVRALTALPSAARDTALGLGPRGAGSDETVLRAMSLLGLSEARVTGRWDAVGVAGALSSAMVAEGSQFADCAQVQTLYACVAGAEAPFSSADAARWQAALAAVADYLFIALCDPMCCNEAAFLVSQLLRYVPTGADELAKPSRIGLLRLLFPAEEAGDDECQATFVSLVEDLLAEGEDESMQAAVRQWLTDFRDSGTEHVDGNPVLRDLLSRL